MLVEDYLTRCRAQGLQPNTVSGIYAFSLKKVLLPWCEREGITEPGQLTPRVLDRLTAELLDKGWTRGSLSRAMGLIYKGSSRRHPTP
jgi:hypothetical protein